MKNNKNRPYAVMCTDIYLLLILVVFPLYYADGYFHLPERKAAFWTVSTLVYIIVTMVGVVISAFAMKDRWNLESFKKNVTLTDIFMFGFLISNLIALTMTNNVLNSWVGAGSRYYGARVLILVCIAYFLLSRYGWINKVFVIALLIGGNGVCLLATFDYFGMDVLGINRQMMKTDWLMFISTMGNANTCASYVCMALAGAMSYFCVAEGKKSKIFAGISIINCAAALVTSRSDSAFVGIAVITIVLGILAVTKKVELKAYICMLALTDAGLFMLYILRKVFVKHLILEQFDSGIPRALNQPALLTIVFLLLMVIYTILHVIEKKEIKFNTRMKIVSAIIAGIVVIVTVAILAVKLNAIQIFKEGMGVNGELKPGTRAYTYQRTVQSFVQLPLRHKIFGCGQATFFSVLSQFYGEELGQVGISINSAHNNVLDYLIMTGLFGTVCYLGTIVCAVKHAFKAFAENKYAVVFAGCVMAYFAQGLFNIDQTNTTTVFWLMVACCEAMYRENVIKKDK